MKKILFVGGGSGGHILPLIGVATVLKSKKPDWKMSALCEKSGVLSDILEKSDVFNGKTYKIFAGKFRRYHGEGWRQILDLKTMFFNLRDAIYTLLGLVQSFFYLLFNRPDFIFLKGGFVSVPIGLCAALLRIPYSTHDSDILPGLANRIVSRWAKMHFVGMPAELYNYPQNKTFFVGVPLQQEYVDSSIEKFAEYRSDFAIEKDEMVLFITGGGLGAQRLNNDVVSVSKNLLEKVKTLKIYHQSGRGNEQKLSSEYDNILPKDLRGRVFVTDGFITDMWRYYGASDVVLTRAGATNMAECAALSKPTVVVPNPYLTGGHQLHNADTLKSLGAIKVVHEGQVRELEDTLVEILTNRAVRIDMSKNISEIAVKNSAEVVANKLIEAVI